MQTDVDRSHLFVVFGAMGDLAHRKLLPALYRLHGRREAGGDGYVLGVTRRDLSEAAFRQRVTDSLAEAIDAREGHPGQWAESRCFHHRLAKDEPDFDELRRHIEALERAHDLPGNRTFYLSIPPRGFEPTIERLSRAGLSASPGATRLIIEKPFGRDLETAQRLNDVVGRHFDEAQIFRIDHYLGKTTVQNLLVFRFGNVIFESIWNRDRIERVEITASETLGVGDRAGYYDQAGAVRDMIQNHLTQLLTLTAMEAPSAFGADEIRREKIKVLDAVAPIDPVRDVVLGQYTAGRIEGEEVVAYGDEPGVERGSTTETFALVRLRVGNWRWDGVPFYLRTGKRLAQPLTQILVKFRCAPASLFRGPDGGCAPNSDLLVITLKPDEGFDLRFDVKTPHERLDVEPQSVRFRYEEAYGPLPDAYETLLRDVMQGDQTTFVHRREAEAAWALYAPVLESRLPISTYRAGSWGPPEADRLLGGAPPIPSHELD